MAILGILLINMQLFFSPMSLMMLGRDWWPGLADQVVKVLLQFFAQGKFYTLFSLLFGLGMAIQMQRAEARGRSFPGFFSRRLFWLLVIGLVHAFLIWFGDILGQYALLGFALLLFRRRKDTTLVVWIVVLMLVPLILFGGLFGLMELARLNPEAAAEIERQIAEGNQANLALAEEARDVYAAGGYAEILSVRAREVGLIYRFLLFGGPGILAMFLIGFLLGRRGFFRDLETRLPGLLRWTPVLLVVGVAANAAVVVTHRFVNPMEPSPLMMLQQAGFLLGGPSFCLLYVAGLASLYRRERWRRRLRWLAPVGRMALTNYLTHSIVFTTMANSYGLGLYGRISFTVGLGMTLAIYAAQIGLSRWWLRRFRFGPAEWLWRSLTYFRPQPMRRQGS